MWFQRRRFFKFLQIQTYKKSTWPPGWGQFWPRAITWGIIVEVYNTMFHAKYLSSRLWSFREIDFFKFLLYTYKKTHDTPRVGANFDPRTIIWTTFVEVHYTMFLAKYLSSSIYVYSFGEEVLSFGCHGNQSCAWNDFFNNFEKESCKDHF